MALTRPPEFECNFKNKAHRTKPCSVFRKTWLSAIRQRRILFLRETADPGFPSVIRGYNSAIRRRRIRRELTLKREACSTCYSCRHAFPRSIGRDTMFRVFLGRPFRALFLFRVFPGALPLALWMTPRWGWGARRHTWPNGPCEIASILCGLCGLCGFPFLWRRLVRAAQRNAPTWWRAVVKKNSADTAIK